MRVAKIAVEKELALAAAAKKVDDNAVEAIVK